MQKHRGRDRKNLVGRRVAHLDARHGRQEHRVPPRIAPKPFGSGESERNAKWGAYKRDGVFEMKLGVDWPIGIERLERRAGAHRRHDQSDDRNDHEHFDEREAALAVSAGRG